MLTDTGQVDLRHLSDHGDIEGFCIQLRITADVVGLRVPNPDGVKRNRKKGQGPLMLTAPKFNTTVTFCIFTCADKEKMDYRRDRGIMTRDMHALATSSECSAEKAVLNKRNVDAFLQKLKDIIAPAS